MKLLKKSHLILLLAAVLILLGCIGMTAYLLFSNYQNIRLFKLAQSNFQRGDAGSLELADAQLQQVISKDDDNESAYVMLGEIAQKTKNYPQAVYYCYMAHRLNPLSSENKERYIRSLCFARYFDRLENFLVQQDRTDKWNQLLLYAAGHNGNIKKYKLQLERRDQDNRIGELALLLFEHKQLSHEDKIRALERAFAGADAFLQQELLAAQAEIYLEARDFDNAEKALIQACDLNEFAFAPVLGRFYANFRTFGQALTVLEKYLAVYHDPTVAMQTAEIYCLLNQTGKISLLRNKYQAEPGEIAMLCCYYFDALTAWMQKDMTALKEYVVPLRKTVRTPLAAFMFFCVDLQDHDLKAVQESYTALLAQRNYLDLQNRADSMLSQYLKAALKDAAGKEMQLLPLAALLHERKPEVFTAKFLLLAQKKNKSVNIALLKDALTRFKDDQGIVKIAIEYYLDHEISRSKDLIAYYKETFPERSGDMLRYEIVLAMKQQDPDRVSHLFRTHFSPEILPEYWQFALSTMREEDLLFLSRDQLYEPFCKALLALKKGDREAACDLLQNADAKGNLALLFFAAKTLGENGRNQAALEKYALFPANSPYYLTVLLNMAELYSENGEETRALDLSRQAYHLAPGLPETQRCYADKLGKCGKWTLIPDIVRLTPRTPWKKQMKALWIAGMQHRIKEQDIHTQQEKARELCRQLLVVDPDNHTALELLKKLNKMPQ